MTVTELVADRNSTFANDINLVPRVSLLPAGRREANEGCKRERGCNDIMSCQIFARAISGDVAKFGGFSVIKV